MRGDDLAYHRQRPREDRDAGFATRRRKGKRVGFPCRVLDSELPFDILALHPLPMAVAYFAQTVARGRFEPALARDDPRGLQRARERAGIDGRDALTGQSLAQARRLPSALFRQLGARRTGEAVFLRGCRRTVTNEKQASDRWLGHELLLPRHIDDTSG